MKYPQAIDVLKKISNIPTATFYEHFIHDEIKKIFFNLFDQNPKVDLIEDEFNNLIIHYQGDPIREHPKSIGFAIHTDHPAFHLTPLDHNRYIAKMMGGINPNLVLNSEVNLYHHEKNTDILSRGKFISKLPSSTNDTSHKYILKSDSKNVEATFATFSFPEMSIDKLNLIHAPVLDDLAAFAMSLESLTKIIKNNLPVDIYLICHRAEEIGFIGAYGLANSNLLPKDIYLLSIETSSYKVQKNINSEFEQLAQIGGGIIIRTGDRITPVYHLDTLYFLQNAANDYSGKTQRLRMYGGSCEAALYYAMGYRSAGICLPLIGWHNDGSIENKNQFIPEATHLHDFETGIEFMFHCAQSLSHSPNLYQKMGTSEISSDQKEMLEKIKTKFELYRKKGLI